MSPLKPSTATPEVEIAGDQNDGVYIVHETPLIDEGVYNVVVTNVSRPIKQFDKLKLCVACEILEGPIVDGLPVHSFRQNDMPGPSPVGMDVPAYFNVHSEHGRLSYGRRSKLKKFMERMLGRRMKATDRITPRAALGRCFHVAVRTVRTDGRGHPLDEYDMYSVVDDFIALIADPREES